MSLKIVIKIEQKPKGVGWTIEPCPQLSATANELAVGRIMMHAIDEVMKDAASKLGVPLQLVSIDDPRNPRP